MNDIPITFLAVSFSLVIVLVEFVLPYRAGRGFMTMYDQLRALALIGVLAGYAGMSSVRFTLWVPGMIGLTFGLIACVLFDLLGQRLGRRRVSHQPLFCVSSILSVPILSVGGIYLGRTILA